MKTRQAIILAALAIFVFLAISGLLGGRGKVPQGQPALVSLNPSNLTDLRREFNASSNQARVVILVAPT